MKRKIHSYEAEGITIRYERKRCIHALDCVRGLPDVFSLTRRRWIDATLAKPPVNQRDFPGAVASPYSVDDESDH